MSRRLILWLLGLALTAVLVLTVLVGVFVLWPEWQKLSSTACSSVIDLFGIECVALAGGGFVVLAFHLPRLRADGLLRSAVATHAATAAGGLALGLLALAQDLRPLILVGFTLLIFGAFPLTRKLRRDLRVAEAFLDRFVTGETLPDLPPNPGPAMAPLIASLSRLTATGAELETARGRWLELAGQAAAQEERKRLARDLHDSIKQQLWGIQLSAATAEARWESDPAGARRALFQVTSTTRQAFDEIKALLSQLLPQAIATGGLLEALREQCAALAERTGAKVGFSPGEPIPWERLPSGAAEMLFRSTQEALANITRHAGAANVRVALHRPGDEVTLRIEDDGRGFDPGREISGMGLANLRRRAAAFGGTVAIESAPGAGTTILLTVPLIPDSAQAGAPPPREWNRALAVERGLAWGSALVAASLIGGLGGQALSHLWSGAEGSWFRSLLVVVWMIACMVPSFSLAAQFPLSPAANRLRQASHRSRAWLTFVLLCLQVRGLVSLHGTALWVDGASALAFGSVTIWEIWCFTRRSRPPWRAPARARRWLVVAAVGGLAGFLALVFALGENEPLTVALAGGFVALGLASLGWSPVEGVSPARR